MVRDRVILNKILHDRLSPFVHRCFNSINQGKTFLTNWHVDLICEYLEAVYRGEIRRLNINIPPRFLKSEICSQAFPMWVMGREPSKKIIALSFNASLATDFHNNCRRIARSPWFLSIFPEFQLSSKATGDISEDNMKVFKTTKGGVRFSTSVGGTITGKGADIIIADDLMSPAQANSDAERASVIQWTRSSMFSRDDDPKKLSIVHIQQRLHIQDTTALFEEFGFQTLKIPYRNNTESDIYYDFGRVKKVFKAGEWLHPERFSEEEEKEKVMVMGSSAFSAQYAQEPQPLGGSMFLQEWVQYHDVRPEHVPSMNVYILVDAANSKRKNSDYTAMVVIGLGADRNYYVLDIIRDKLNLAERTKKLFDLHKKWLQHSGRPPRVGYEKYGMMADTEYIQEKKRELNYNFPLQELGGKIGKEERVMRLEPLFEARRFYLPRALPYVRDGRSVDLVNEFLNGEYMIFPTCLHDDVIDAMSRIADPQLGAVFPSSRPKNYRPTVANNTTSYMSW